MKGLLEGTVRLVTLQFSATNPSFVPERLPRKGKETVEQFVVRKSAIKGHQILEPVERVSGLYFSQDLEGEGYQPVDAFARTMEKDGRPFTVARFVSVAEQYVDSSEEFLKIKPICKDAQVQIVTQALWRIRAFLNPFFENGEVVDGQYAISVNFEARVPLVDKDGKPLLQWRKDERGERIGDAPVPIEPRLFLRIENGDLCFKSA